VTVAGGITAAGGVTVAGGVIVVGGVTVRGGVIVAGGVTVVGGTATTGALAVVNVVVPKSLSPIAFLARTLTLYRVPSFKFDKEQVRAVTPEHTRFPLTSTS
jgi:tetrahydrodipicolinate N-succinyltransferase